MLKCSLSTFLILIKRTESMNTEERIHELLTLEGYKLKLTDTDSDTLNNYSLYEKDGLHIRIETY